MPAGFQEAVQKDWFVSIALVLCISLNSGSCPQAAGRGLAAAPGYGGFALPLAWESAWPPSWEKNQDKLPLQREFAMESLHCVS